MASRQADDLLLGEWACLGIIYRVPMHGFAVAAQLKPEGDIGRVWTMSRALTYRSIDQLVERDMVVPVAEEQGIAGGNRTVYKCTRKGSAAIRKWLQAPVPHLRDLRSELLLKLVIGEATGIDLTGMIAEQTHIVAAQLSVMRTELKRSPDDAVLRWRVESADAALRFLNRL